MKTRDSCTLLFLTENFTSDQVPESGKETCRNWFFKIASIRELIPRFLVETAILKCYSYLTNREYTQALIRLTKMVRGIGDPLVAAYARAYLCRVGMAVAPESTTHLMPNFTDYLSTLSQLNADSVQNVLAVQRLNLTAYLNLFVPAVEWILQCIAHQAPEVDGCGVCGCGHSSYWTLSAWPITPAASPHVEGILHSCSEKSGGVLACSWCVVYMGVVTLAGVSHMQSHNVWKAFCTHLVSREEGV